MTLNSKKIILLSIIALSIGTASISFGITLSYFEKNQTIKDNLNNNLTIAADGIRTTNYYLNTNNLWSGYDNAVFYALVWKNGDTTKYQWIRQTDSGSNYLYAIDTVAYQKIRFIRFNTTGDVTPSSYADGSGAKVYNRTAELTLGSNKTYKITSWGDGTTTDAGGYWE